MIGYYIYSNSNNLIANSTSENSSNYGFLLGGGSTSNRIVNNSANGSLSAFYLITSSNNTLANNTAQDASLRGFFLYSSSLNNSLEGNTAINCSTGFEIQSSSLSRMSGNTAYNNSFYGVYLNSPGTASLAGDHLYANARDFRVQPGFSAAQINMAGVIFDHAGDGLDRQALRPSKRKHLTVPPPAQAPSAGA